MNFCREVLVDKMDETCKRKRVLPCDIKAYFNHYFIFEGIYCMFLCKLCFVFLPSLKFVSTYASFDYIKECCDQYMMLPCDQPVLYNSFRRPRYYFYSDGKDEGFYFPFVFGLEHQYVEVDGETCTLLIRGYCLQWKIT